jgi:two-component system, NarL family, sensor histidine kinase DesK
MLSSGDRARTIATVVGAAFSLVLVPAWMGALAEVTPDNRIPAMGVGVVYSVGCVLAVPLARTMGSGRRVIVCLTLVVLGIVFVGLTGMGNSWVLTCALGIVAAMLPLRATLTVTLGTAVVLLISSLYAGTVEAQLPNIVIIVTVTAVVALLVRLVDTNAQLERARDEIALLAVTRERERIARDLHDVLGHSLTAISLKAGLARRVLETGDLAQLTIQIRDVEELGRQAMTDLRAAVTDCRVVTLAAELAIAAEMLRAAGIDADLPTALDDVPPAHRAVFGFVLREAVTNAVRHSGANRVSVRLTHDSIRVTDDGPGTPVDPGSAGNGLRGLTERMAAIGGTLVAGPDASAGFTVHATAPSGARS